MKTNEKADINAGWQPNGKVKPAHINALTGSIQYDYVITDRMLENKSGEVSVNDLFQSGAISGRSGEFHVLVNSVVPGTITLVFDAGNAGGQDPLNVHVHCITAFKGKVTGSDDHVTYYFHTHGTANPVTLYGVGKHTYVGSFSTGTSITLASGATFVYENALNGVSAITGTTTQSLWMTNASLRIKPDWNAAAGSDAEILNKPTIPTVNNGTLTIQKNGSNVATFSANQSTAATANIEVPTKTSDLNNDAGFITAASLPTVNDGTLTIQRNKVQLGQFTANQSGNTTINMRVPEITTFETVSEDEDITVFLNNLQINKNAYQLTDGSNTLALLPPPTGSADYDKLVYRWGNRLIYKGIDELVKGMKIVTTSSTYAQVTAIIAANEEPILKVTPSGDLSQYFQLSQVNPDGSIEFTCMRGGNTISAYRYILDSNGTWTRTDRLLGPYTGTAPVSVSSGRAISLTTGGIDATHMSPQLYRQLRGSEDNEAFAWPVDKIVKASSSKWSRFICYVWDIKSNAPARFTQTPSGTNCVGQFYHLTLEAQVSAPSGYNNPETTFTIDLAAADATHSSTVVLDTDAISHYHFGPEFNDGNIYNIRAEFDVDVDRLPLAYISSDPELCFFCTMPQNTTPPGTDNSKGLQFRMIRVTGFCWGHA